MQKSMRLLLCASTAALILGAAPIGAFIAPAQAQVAISISATIAPPLLPVYAQPAIPGPGYLWIPGYWAWNGSRILLDARLLVDAADGRFLLDAALLGLVERRLCLQRRLLGSDGRVLWRDQLRFRVQRLGYQGGMWQGNTFVYNRTVNNFGNVNIANSYSRPVSNPG